VFESILEYLDKDVPKWQPGLSVGILVVTS
jgi:hypothetical protein